MIAGFDLGGTRILSAARGRGHREGLAVNPSEDMRGIYDVGVSMDAYAKISESLAPIVADIKQAPNGDAAI
jgi:hypothetical protein